jgi:hypothetical protein
LDEPGVEYGASHPIEEFEELRLCLKSFLKKELLDEILFLYKELSKEPRQSEMYTWFVRNSSLGGDCRYAQSALKAFKEQRLGKLEELLERCLAAAKDMKD